ncbi:MAG: biopolymer transporter ExbD [Candidatus Gastranaerophilales bacterium]|nr:biopolymer transporter ExbD [Candidatus Gastranaerophilales bacterium]
MRDSFNEINITPLTDIFLVLLIIMMVIAPMMDQQGLKLVVPQAVKEQSTKEFKTINFQITSDGRYYLDNEEISVENLENTISAKVQTCPDGLLIMPDANSEHGAVVKLIDVARSVGVTSVSVQGG